MKEYWTSLASLLGVLAFCQSLLQVVFPPELRFATVKLFNRMFHWFSSFCYFDITEIDGVNTNELYNAVQLYLSSSVSITGSRLSLTRALNSSAITFGLSNNDSIVDTFNGVSVLWEHVVTQRQSQTFSWRPLPEEKRGFTLRIRKRDKAKGGGNNNSNKSGGFYDVGILLKNYLGLDESDLDGVVMKELEGVIEKAEMTPADVSEVLIKNRRDKRKAVREVLEALKVRAERIEKSNGRLRKKGSEYVEEEEEQEKRALESPKEGCEFQEESNCKEGNDEKEKQDSTTATMEK
ncbi:AAA-ATPase At5g57480 [Fagus crenata]